MGAHSDFAPSARRRWRACPGSVRLIRALDLPDIDTPYSLEGSEAHGVAADALVHDRAPTDARVLPYVEYVRSLPGAKLIEEPLAYPTAPTIGGTPDAVAYDFSGTLEVVDFKFGEGMVVSPEGNPQLEMYAVLAALTFDAEVKEVRLTIVQPRTEGEPVHTAVYPGSVLVEWDHAIGEEITACADPEAPLVSGQHCQFCKAKAHCPELRSHTDLAAGYRTTMPAPERLRPEQLSWLLANRKQITGYLDSVADYALQQALAGKLPGWKAVGTLKNREWVNPDEALKAMKKLGHKLDEVAPRKLISPAQADRLLDRKWVEVMVKRDPGGPKLVREDDPGEPINVLAGFSKVEEV